MDEHDQVEPTYPEPIRVLQHGPPLEVHLRGALFADPRLMHTSVPAAHQWHELVKGRYFYTVPRQLLDSVCRPQAGEKFDVDEKLLEMETDLSRISGDHGQRVGFWDNTPIECNLMHATPIRREDLAMFHHLSDQRIDSIIRTANKRLLSFSEISCGYAGWLMTNPTFLTELEALVSEYGRQMHRWGTSLVGLPIPSTQPAGSFNPTIETGWQEYDSDVLEFCIRWRLRGLAGPRIPLPMQPMMAGQVPASILSQLMRAGGVFNWPDTFPVFARDELRDLMAEALLSSDSKKHLAGWQSIIDSKNKAKNQIKTLERRFRLQHFWRLLCERHPSALRKRLNRVEGAFAKYLGVKETTIRLDRMKLAEALGKAWDQPKGHS